MQVCIFIVVLHQVQRRMSHRLLSPSLLLGLLLLGLSACHTMPEQNKPVDAHSSALEQTSTSVQQQMTQCQQAEVALQVLGSGGPIADDDRASSSYLIWYQGRALALVDLGGGSFQRFGAAGAQLDQLALIALSHLHTDHSADLPALMKGAYFSSRRDALPLYGPQGTAADASGDPFPSTDEFITALFARQSGAFRYLAGLLDGTDGLFQLTPMSLDSAPGQRSHIQIMLPARNTVAATVLALDALGVHHGSVPALAYRLQIGGRSVVFSGDQSEHNPMMAEFARNADALVAHLAIPPQAGRSARSLHRTPQSWGQLAAQSDARQLVLSHWMQRSLNHQAEAIAAIRENYSGPLVNATDLTCVVL